MPLENKGDKLEFPSSSKALGGRRGEGWGSPWFVRMRCCRFLPRTGEPPQDQEVLAAPQLQPHAAEPSEHRAPAGSKPWYEW